MAKDDERVANDMERGRGMFRCMKNPALPLLALTAVCIALVTAYPAYAEESTQSDDLWGPSVVVITDKAEYPSGERILVAATAENDVAEHAQKTASGDEGVRTEGLDELACDMEVVIGVPDGYAVVEGSAKASATGVMPGEKVTARAVLAKQSGASGAGAATKATSSSAKTGDAPWIPVFAALAAISAVILAIAALKRRGSKGAGSRTLSCLLALVLVAGLAPWAPGSAHAAEEAASNPEHVGRGSTTFSVGGKSVTVTAAAAAEHGENESGFDEIPDGYGQPSPGATEDRTPRVEAVITDAQAASSDETASETLEAADKVLEAIGQFVESVSENDPGEAIQGAGSVLGVIAKGITIIEGASGPSYDLIDVVERLDSISSDVKGLTSQVGKVSSQLDSIRQQTEFTMTGNEVADLVATGLRYKGYVTGAMDALNRTGITGQSVNDTQPLVVEVAVPPASGDASGNTLVAAQLVAQDVADRASQIRANYNGLSDEDKSTLQSLANQTKHAATYYGASAYETAVKLADKATATTWGMDNIYKAYSKYVGSYLNWEPETYSLVKAYTAELNLAFSYSYIAAMNELNIEIVTTSDEDIKEADLHMLQQLLEASDKVCAVNKSTDVKALMEPRSDGKVRNLVTGTLFEPYSGDWNYGFAGHAFTARLDLALADRVNGWIPKDLNLDRADKFPVQRYESAISRDQFETMFSRLDAVRTIGGYEGATSLKAEMELMGLLPSSYAPDGFGSNTNWDEYADEGGWVYRFSKNSVNTGGDKSLRLKICQQARSCYYFYTGSDDNTQKVKDQESVEHIRDITGTAVNIAATSHDDLVKNVVLYRLDEKYVTGHGWRLYVTYHPLALAVSAGS